MKDSAQPSAEELKRLLATYASVPSQRRYVLLLVVSIGMTGIIGILLLTEMGLPVRTRVAMSVMIAIGLSWTVFAAWTLARRQVLFGRHRVVAARLATVCTGTFAVGAAIVNALGAAEHSARAAAGVGVAMFVIAVAAEVQSRRQVAALNRRRVALEGKLAASIVLLLAVCAGGANAQQGVTIAQGTFVVGSTSVPVDEGSLVVPANRTADSGKTLKLAFARFRSTAASPGSPIVFLAGGPGDAATRALRGMPLEFLRRLTAIADVIAFDQRGTGLSEPRNPFCPPGAMLPTDRPAAPQFMLDTLRKRVAACLADARRGGVDVMGLTTAESADDLEALRSAIGAVKLTLLAGSYGTHLALTTARRHPSLVDRMALIGVEGPDDTFKLPSRVMSVLEAIATARRPTLIDDVRTLTTRLATTPGRFAFPTGQVIVVGEWDLQRWISESLDTTPEIDAMLAAVPALLQGDYAVLGQWALRYRVPKPLGLMNLAMDCASFASAPRLSQMREESVTALLGDAINFPLPGLCDVAGLPRLPDSFRAPKGIDTPTLLVSGTFDGRTPVQNAIDQARGMTRVQSLVIDGASHDQFRVARVLDAIVAFFHPTSLR